MPSGDTIVIVNPTSPRTFELPAAGGVVELPREGDRCDLRGLRWRDAAGRYPADVNADAGFMETVVRGVLKAGLRLRFEAHGHSMRPWIPDGCLLDVDPARNVAIAKGQVLLYATGPHRCVAHRVIDVLPDHVVLRGDNASREDKVPRDDVLGIVAAITKPDGTPVAVDALPFIGLAPTWNTLNAAGRATLRTVVVAPAATATRILRVPIRTVLHALSWVLHRIAVAAQRVRIPVDRLHALLLSTEEKRSVRDRLYADLGIQTFTALSENLDAGLTLLEEHQRANDGRPLGRVLVVGCGPGREAFALAGHGGLVTGIDTEPAMLQRARTEAARRNVNAEFREGDAVSFDLGNDRFDTIVVWSGLLCMIHPAAARVAMLANCRRHLAPGGKIWVTFLVDYVDPRDDAPAPRPGGFAKRVNPDHDVGDLWLHNEAVHVYPRTASLLAEIAAAGLGVERMFRDQRAYDRRSHVRGYATLGEGGR